MPPVKIKFIVSFTSQDENFKALNLIKGFKKWLSNSKDKLGETTVTFQLEQECVISYIDIGTHWCANIEIQVGRSDWPQGKQYETLAPTCIMMKPTDCNLGVNFACTRMFSGKDFNSNVASKAWDRIKVICRQPLRKDKQFGLSFIQIKTSNSIASNDDDKLSALNQQKSVKSIQKHFFGKVKSSNSPVNEVKNKLLKIVGSSENGTDQEGAMSRTAKLVLAASTSNKPKEATQNKSALYSETLAQKLEPEFKEMVEKFLSELEISEDELDRITIADLRHKIERKKKRKLDRDERKTFAEMARSYICKHFGGSDDEKEDSEKSLESKDKDSCKEQNKVTVIKDKQVSENLNNISAKKSETCEKIMSRNLTTVKQKKQTDIVDQLKQIRQNAHDVYKSKKEEKSEENCPMPSSQNAEIVKNNKYGKNMPSEDEIYKSMSYLERKAFALTNPYRANRYGSALTFGPSKLDCETDDQYLSPKSMSSPSTNNQWLSKVNTSRNDVMKFSSTPQGKRKRGSSGPTREKDAKVARNSDEIENHNISPFNEAKTKSRGNPFSREITPTSFERCPNCKESFAPSQITSHKDSCAKNDVVVIDREPDYTCTLRDDGVGSTPEYVECPLCNEFYGADVVQFHAANCGDIGY